MLVENAMQHWKVTTKWNWNTNMIDTQRKCSANLWTVHLLYVWLFFIQLGVLNDVQIYINFSILSDVKKKVFRIEELEKGEYCYWNEI